MKGGEEWEGKIR
jgi:hypothetical protein